MVAWVGRGWIAPARRLHSVIFIASLAPRSSVQAVLCPSAAARLLATAHRIVLQMLAARGMFVACLADSVGGYALRRGRRAPCAPRQ